MVCVRGVGLVAVLHVGQHLAAVTAITQVVAGVAEVGFEKVGE